MEICSGVIGWTRILGAVSLPPFTPKHGPLDHAPSVRNGFHTADL